MFAYCFEYVRQTNFFAIMYASKHSATRYKYGRNIKTSCCNQHTWYNFIAVWNKYHRIEWSCHSSSFNRISNNITCYQRIFHTDMIHCKTIANTNCVKFDWYTTCVANTIFYGLYNIFQAHMTRNNFIEGISNTNDWST